MKSKPGIAIMMGIGPKPRGEEAPPKFGGDSEPAPVEESAEEEAAEGESGIPPEAVCYRGAEKQCQSCEYMGEDGMCSKLMMQVEPEAGCNLHEAKESAANEVEVQE
jgi:hypothetical protein